jgi:hypothetical protein
MRMTRLSLVFLAFAVLSSFSRADDVTNVTRIPPEHRKVLVDASHFREVHATTNLPPAIVAICADRKGKLAEPGQVWNPTDLISDDGRPESRLVWAATNENYYVVHYERGGEMETSEILIATLGPDSKKPTIVWHGYAVYLLKDYRAFVREMQANRLIDGQ